MATMKRKPEDLRSRAERILIEDPNLASSHVRADLEELLHELDVYRIELEIQNEELRASQERVQESRNRYYELYNLAPVGFLTIDPIYPYRVLGANTMASRMLGVTRAELAGMSFSLFAAAEDISTLHDFIKRLKQSEEELTAEIRMHRKSPPGEFFTRIQAVQVRNSTKGDRILAAMSDVSEPVRARQVLQRDRDELEKAVQGRTAELESANRQLGEKNRELQDFAFIASHDLREPIRKVLTFGTMLEERYGKCLDESGRDYLDRMKKASSRMERMLVSLLEYARLDTRPRPFGKVDLNDILRQVQSNLSEEIARKDGQLKLGKLPVVEAEPEQMVQLFQNLIANALKYSERPPEISVYAEDGRGRCTIYVVDNGIGFEPRYRDKIFSPFERLHGREEYEGTGMGLTICRKITERHKGGITATSTPGEGSVFIVTLPCRK